MRKIVAAFVVVTFLATGGLGCKKRTPEEIHQLRMERISRPPYLENKGAGVPHQVVEIRDDLPNSSFVRVLLVPVNSGQYLAVLHPKSSPLQLGQTVEIIFAEYMFCEGGNTYAPYIKVN